MEWRSGGVERWKGGGVDCGGVGEWRGGGVEVLGHVGFTFSTTESDILRFTVPNATNPS